MAIIVKKDCNFGKNISFYTRIGKLEYSFKQNKWTCFIEYYYNKEAAQDKKIADWLREWTLQNPDKINDAVFAYLQQHYFIKEIQIIPLLQHSFYLDNVLSPQDFDDGNQILEWLYYQIKNKPELIEANEFIEDVYEDKDSLLQPILDKLKEIYEQA